MKPDKELEKLEHMIDFFQKLVLRYPLSTSYEDSLYDLQQQRTNYVDKIGRK